MVPMPSKSPVATSVNDFTALPLRLTSTTSFPKQTAHYLYLRANTPKLPTEDTPREVFLVNVPVDATETHLRSLFADQLGGARVESVAFEGARVGKGITAPVAPAKKGKKRKRGPTDEGEEVAEEVGQLPEVWDREMHASGGTATVTFVDKASAELARKRARKAVKEGSKITWGLGVDDRVPPLGLARYQAHHKLQYPDPATLQHSVDAFMSAFSAAETTRTKSLTRQRSIPDADGFITVTRGGRTGPAREEEVKAQGEELKKRDKTRVKEDFYRFQVREKRKAEQQDLVKGYEEDRRRVEEMRRRRGRVRPE
ncbi:hypothetical protein LTR36_007260 [Oleoguttula mirabilis]|uniref:Ribosomal RNA-processing protein 7 n=1 Tax=Oleoguttula mirabilis TaxID=1507867 RepID=A0AAV9JAB5_9PEZI|nr:hypothetical protein LTR36_007260 [Oleoguttula mirabilis]